MLSLPTWRDENGSLKCVLGTIYEDASGNTLLGPSDMSTPFVPGPIVFEEAKL